MDLIEIDIHQQVGNISRRTQQILGLGQIRQFWPCEAVVKEGETAVAAWLRTLVL
jgi:hypothetical protein